MELSNSISPPSKKGRYEDSPLLRLPLELRSWIYKYNLMLSRCPSPEDVYSKVLCEVWKDIPSPLLAVNRQVRDEVCEILRRECAISLRVTGQGINFDSLALSSFTAYQQCTFTGNIRRLRIEVWAPHPERPVKLTISGKTCDGFGMTSKLVSRSGVSRFISRRTTDILDLRMALLEIGYQPPSSQSQAPESVTSHTC